MDKIIMVSLTKSTKSTSVKDISAKWHLIDAQGEVLGRLATKLATLLQGKHKSDYVPYLNSGDNVVVVNIAKVKVTGNKLNAKTYDRYSGYPGGRKEINMKTLMQKKPTDVVKNAVYGMLPKNKLRDVRIKNLFLYVDQQHPFVNKFK